MDKILIEICVPVADAKFNAFISPHTIGNDALQIISLIFSSIYEGKFKSSEDTTLCVYETGEILDINKSIYEQNIRNGSKLILI